MNFQRHFSTLKVKRPETLTLFNGTARHINHLSMLYKPLFLLCYLFWAVSQQEHIHKGGKKKASQQDDSAEGTSQQSRKPRRIIFGAVSCFLETHSTFLSHLLNNLQLGICTKHFIFFILFFFSLLKQQLQSRQKQASPQELTRILQRPG